MFDIFSEFFCLFVLFFAVRSQFHGYVRTLTLGPFPPATFTHCRRRSPTLRTISNRVCGQFYHTTK